MIQSLCRQMLEAFIALCSLILSWEIPIVQDDLEQYNDSPLNRSRISYAKQAMHRTAETGTKG